MYQYGYRKWEKFSSSNVLELAVHQKNDFEITFQPCIRRTINEEIN